MMFDNTIDAMRKISISVVKIGAFVLPLSTFSHIAGLCITANACILVQIPVSGHDIRTVKRVHVYIEKTMDKQRN